MERHQAGQEEMLVKVTVTGDSLEAIHRPGGSPDDHRGYSKCRVALGAVMGLVIGALVTSFVLCFFIFTASCEQDAPPSLTTIVLTPCHPKCAEHGLHDIWTVDKAGHYLIHGWVKFLDGTNGDATAWLMENGKNRRLQTKTVNKTIFFFDDLLLVEGMRLTMRSKSNFTDSLFHVYRLN